MEFVSFSRGFHTGVLDSEFWFVFFVLIFFVNDGEMNFFIVFRSDVMRSRCFDLFNVGSGNHKIVSGFIA